MLFDRHPVGGSEQGARAVHASPPAIMRSSSSATSATASACTVKEYPTRSVPSASL